MKDRGILTERDREIIPNEPNHPRRSEIKSRVQYRLQNLKEDLEILNEHEPELAGEIRKQICEGTMNSELREVIEDIHEEVREHRQCVENSD